MRSIRAIIKKWWQNDFETISGPKVKEEPSVESEVQNSSEKNEKSNPEMIDDAINFFVLLAEEYLEIGGNSEFLVIAVDPIRKHSDLFKQHTLFLLKDEDTKFVFQKRLLALEEKDGCVERKICEILAEHCPKLLVD